MKKPMKKRRPAILIRLTPSDLHNLHEHCAGLATPVEAWCRRQILAGVRLKSDAPGVMPDEPEQLSPLVKGKNLVEGLTVTRSKKRIRKSRQV